MEYRRRVPGRKWFVCLSDDEEDIMILVEGTYETLICTRFNET